MIFITVPGKKATYGQGAQAEPYPVTHLQPLPPLPTVLFSAGVEIIFFKETIFYLGNSRRVNVKREKKRRAAAGEEKTKQTGNESQPGATAPRCGHPVAHARTGASPQPPAARDRQLAPTGFWAHAP